MSDMALRSRRKRARRNAKPLMSEAQFKSWVYGIPEARTRDQAFADFEKVLAEVERTIKVVRQKNIPFPPFGEAVNLFEREIEVDWIYNTAKVLHGLESVHGMAINLIKLDKKDPQFFPSLKTWPAREKTLIDGIRDKTYFWTTKKVGPDYVCLLPPPEKCDVKEIVLRYDWDEWQKSNWLWILDPKLNLRDMMDATTEDMRPPPKLRQPIVYRGYRRDDFEELGYYDKPRPGPNAYPWILQARKVLNESGKRLYRPNLNKHDYFYLEESDLYGSIGPWSDSWNDDPEFYSEYISDPSRIPSRKQIEKRLPKSVAKHQSAKAWNYPVPDFLKKFLGASHAKHAQDMRGYGKKYGWCFGSGSQAKHHREGIDSGEERLYFGIDPMTKQPVAVHTKFMDPTPRVLEQDLVLLESTSAPPGKVEVIIEAKYPKNVEAFGDLEEEYYDYNLARQEAKTNSSYRGVRKKRLPRRVKYSRRARSNGSDSPIPDPTRPYFKVPMRELVAMARQGDNQAAIELKKHRGRDPETGRKMFGVAAKFSKGV